METLAQEIFGEYYGQPVSPAFVAIEIRALEMGHAAGTLDAARQRLFAALISAGQVPGHAASGASRSHLNFEQKQRRHG